MGRRSRCYPADGFQGVGVDLVDVVDLRGSVVLVPVADHVDQVVVREVRDGVTHVGEGPGVRGQRSGVRGQGELWSVSL